MTPDVICLRCWRFGRQNCGTHRVESDQFFLELALGEPIASNDWRLIAFRNIGVLRGPRFPIGFGGS